MKLMLLLLALPLLILGSWDFPFITVGEGFVEKMGDEKEVVVDFVIQFNSTTPSDFETFLQNFCNQKRRTKRLVGGVALVGAGAVTVYSIYRATIVDKQLEELQKIANNTADNQSIEWRNLQQTIATLKMSAFQEIGQDVLGISRFERFLDMLEIKKSDVLKAFGIDEKLGLAAFNMMNQQFICAEEPRNFVLRVVHESRTRRYGEVVRVGHIGALINNGLLFKYVEVPKWAVLTPKGPVSAEYCHLVRNRYECAQVEGNCTLARRSACPHKTVLTQGGTYVETIRDSTFIATTEKSYEIYNGSHWEKHQVPGEGHFLLNLPSSWTAQIGQIKIQGRHNRFFVDTVLVEEHLPHADHDEIDRFNENLKKNKIMLSPEHLEELHSSSPFSIFGKLRRHIGYVILIGGLILAGLAFLYIWQFCACCIGCCCRTKNDISQN